MRDSKEGESCARPGGEKRLEGSEKKRCKMGPPPISREGTHAVGKDQRGLPKGRAAAV